MFYWNPWAVAGSVGIALGWALAFLVYSTNPQRSQNRYLALFMVCVSTGIGIACGTMYAADSVRLSAALQVVGLAAFAASAPFYFLFLSTLPTKTMAWLRPNGVRAALLAWAILAFPLVALSADRIIAGVVEVPYAKFDTIWTNLGTRLFEAQSVLTATVGILAAVACIVESRRGSMARRQAKFYALAFVWWEVIQVTAFIILEIAFRSANPNLALYTTAAAIMMPGALLGFILLLSYAILKGQLFDIDIKLRFTVKASTLTGIFLAVFFVVSQVAQNFLSTRYGILMGGAAAGLLLFALRPLESMAGRVAGAALPQVKDTEAYRDFRKLEVYQATVESFVVDGQLTVRERTALDRLRTKLGIAAGLAIALERDALAGTPAKPS